MRLENSTTCFNTLRNNSGVLLLRQIWIVNYYFKCLIISVIKKKKTLVFPEKLYFKNSSCRHFDSRFVLKHLFQTEKKTQTENQHLFDRIIDGTLFDRVEEINLYGMTSFYMHKFPPKNVLKKCNDCCYAMYIKSISNWYFL